MTVLWNEYTVTQSGWTTYVVLQWTGRRLFFFSFFFYQVSSLYSDNMKSYCAGVEASIYYSDKQFPGYTVLFCICFALKIMYKKKKICIGRVLRCFKANVFFFLWLNVFVRKRKVKRTRLKIKKKSSAASCELFIYLHKLLFFIFTRTFHLLG